MAAAVAMSAAASALVGLSVNAPTHETMLKALKVAELKAVCAHLGLVQAGDKTALTDRIRNHKLAAAGAAPAPPPAPVPKPGTPGALASMIDADLRQLCTQEGVDSSGAMADVQARLTVHLFGAPRTTTETVLELCDREFALVLLTAIPAEDDANSHSVAGAWIARALHFALAKQVTVKAVLRRKVKFRRAGQAHDDVVFAETMKPGDPGFAQFVEAWVAELTLVVPLPTLPDTVTAEDAEGALLDVLKVLLVSTGPKVPVGEVPKTTGPMDWLQQLQRVTTAGKPADEYSFDNTDLNKAIAVLRTYGFFLDKTGVAKFSQLILVKKATSAKEDGMSTPGLCVDPRVQPLSLRAMLDTYGNFAPDQAKMVQQSDGAYVETSTPDPVSKKARTAMDVARGHVMYWVAHLVTSIRLESLHSRYNSRTSAGLWLHPYYVAKFQAVMWRVVERVSGDTLDGILTPLLQHVQENTSSADDDAWTGETALEYVCAKVAEQVNFAAAVGGKRTADASGTQQGSKSQKLPQSVTCTICKVRQTQHVSKTCLSCATAAKKAAAGRAPAAAAPAAAAAAPAAGP